MAKVAVTQASKGKIAADSGFQGYDVCVNPWVGCQFGCSYCYVRFFVKDPKLPWGRFVRARDHLPRRLAREIKLGALAGKRVVLGTMTDPYQPAERQRRLTRQALQLLAGSGCSKVGIFTRSPIVLDDLALIASLPKPRVHLTIPPLPRSAQVLMEPIAVRAEARWRAAAQTKAAGISVNVNVAPALPILSDPLVEENARRLAELGPSEFFADSMQPYSESLAATAAAMSGHPDWPAIAKILGDRAAYAAWKDSHRAAWMSAWRRSGSPGTLAIWCDHETKVWDDMATGLALDPKTYDKAS